MSYHHYHYSRQLAVSRVGPCSSHRPEVSYVMVQLSNFDSIEFQYRKLC